MIKGKYQEEGKCGSCGSEDIEYGDLEAEDNSIFYEITCNKCDKSGKEYYGTEYSETYVEE